MRKIYITIFTMILAIIMVFPLIITITNSFMGDQEVLGNYETVKSGEVAQTEKYINFQIIPERATLYQYYNVLVVKNKYIKMFWNTTFIVLPLVLGHVLVASSAAFAFSKLKFKYKDTLFFLYIVVMLMPFQVTLVPNYLILDRLNLINSYQSIILPGIFSAFGVFLLKQFMDGIPNECIEAAAVDGCNTFQIFYKIVLPLCKEGIAALTILFFIENWNMVEQPLVFIKDINKYPLSLYLSNVNHFELGIAFASGVIYMIPMLLIFLYGEEYITEGIKHSDIK
ncbi:carbohydrate ABC transporter permease [Alkaliphilus transvaalensis]|uniref:carbohydrate ABC transporter permease n=1 Tax=Alkaliphilus transvaalensis TaxID=114628 RepID=UPI0005599FD3|nr:carbohydrate ABC transporter permease [Alkaliphilus transvaalensis]